MRLYGKTVLITGAASGIGAATAERMAAEGANVAAVDLDGTALAQRVEQITAVGGSAFALPGDCSQEPDVERAVEGTLRRFGRIDVLFNNAAVGFSSASSYVMAPLTETTKPEWDAVIGVNLGSVHLCSRAVIPVMARQGKGSIIHNSSVMALKGYPGADAYTAAKGAMIALTRVMAVQYGPAGVRVNCICPGVIKTPIQAGLDRDPAWVSEMSAKIPLRRLGEAAEVASVVAFLASDEAAYLTGVVLPVDGGFVS
ncbi:MAG: SDR family oxidoreductase [Trueperaceae bacterium]|nr:MAG: SDR family oxidoreductase [Trueperaceae bacterium]